jgi:hypothetical protein
MAGKVGKVMHEFKVGTLRSGKRGPGKGRKVTSRKQAIAIGLSEARRAGESVAPKFLRPYRVKVGR